LEVVHAIIGCGRVAPNHVDGFESSPGARLKWACDRDPALLAAFAREHGIARATPDYREVLADPEVMSVSVAVDHAQHAAIAREALAAGKHVLVEKPQALGYEEALGVAGLARERGLILAVVSQHRYDPLLVEVKRLLDGGALGRLVSVWATLQCRREPEYYSESYWRGRWAGEGGSALINQGYHYVDLMCWLGGEVSGVSAAMTTLKLADVIETEDTLSAILRYESGALGTFSVTNASDVFWRSRIDLVGTAGSLRFDIDHPDTLHFQHLPPAAEKELREFLERDVTAHQPPPGKDYYGISHRFQIREFVEAVGGGGRVGVDGFEALRTLRVVLDIYDAARGAGG
jgi:predicted dehydrogenase